MMTVEEYATWRLVQVVDGSIDAQRAAYLYGKRGLQEVLDAELELDAPDLSAVAMEFVLLTNHADWEDACRSITAGYDPVSDGARCPVCGEDFTDRAPDGSLRIHADCAAAGEIML